MCDIKVLKVESVGQESAVEYIKGQSSQQAEYSVVKESIEETCARAKYSFSHGKYDQALKLYQRITQTVQAAKTRDEKEVEDRKGVLKRMHTNLAICYNKKEEWRDSIVHIRLLEELGAIDRQPKVLFAKGRALMKLGEIEEAQVNLLKAQRLNPLNPEINGCIAELASRKNSYNEFSRSFAKKLLIK